MTIGLNDISFVLYKNKKRVKGSISAISALILICVTTLES